MPVTSNRPFSPTSSLRVIAVLALVFGGATVFSAGNVLFGPVAVRELAGNIVPFVVWFNFVAGFLYILAAVWIWRAHGWAVSLSALIAAATALVALLFGAQVLAGTPFEMRTVGALALRTGFWTAIAWAIHRSRRRL